MAGGFAGKGITEIIFLTIIKWIFIAILLVGIVFLVHLWGYGWRNK